MTAITVRPNRAGRREVRHFITGVLFASPWIVGFIVFTLYPIGASLYYSFMRYDIVREPIYVGLGNYREMLFNDATVRVVIGNTLFFVMLGVPAAVITAFLLASLLNNDFKGRPIFRTVFFLPSIVPAVASAEVWRWVYNPRYGLVNASLANLGISGIPFLSSPALAKPSLLLIELWAQGTAVVVFLAALQDVPRSLYDAALVDGANAVQRFFHVTIPMCTPSILFITLTGLIGAFQYFTLGWLLTGGGPKQATELYSIYLYRNAFRYFKMGYASALAWLLFLLIVTFTVVVFRSSARWTYYGGEGT